MKRKSPLFKKCSGCGSTWLDRSPFLSDPNVRLVGYQVHFEDLELGLFLFNHYCGSTISVEAKVFTDLYKGPVFKDNKTGTGDCPGLCLHSEEFSPCPAKCECAYVREVLLLINNTRKKK